MRPFLLYLTVKDGKCESEIHAPDRLFDLAINNWNGGGERPECEYYFTEDLWKYKGAYKHLAGIWEKYEAIAFFDDDLIVDGETINQLFRVGIDNGLSVWQPALSRKGTCFFRELQQQPDSTIRPTRFVEVMVPFIAKDAMTMLWHTFDLNESGYALDHLWGHILGYHGMAVIDHLPVIHCRRLNSPTRKTPGGKWPREEAEELKRRFGFPWAASLIPQSARIAT